MTRHGDIGITEPLAHEVHFQVEPNATLGTNTYGDYHCHTYTMPMTGTLAVCLYSYFRIAGLAQEVSGVMSISSPGPTGDFGFSIVGLGVNDSYLVGKDIGFWNPVAAGTVVNIYQRFSAGYFPNAVNLFAINGFARSMRQ